ncbi:MAG: FAD-dependent oxidoreductase [Gammaproteobacteria bacterium]|nr:FAD-dependent oxidoreductase [Gammaproteobacteria bacterium]
MTTHARVAVIGGGAVGASILYHLAQLGWSDCVLLERTELTAGSTWHAAGLLPLYHPDYTMSHINLRSLELYARLEAETGQPVSFHQCGQLRLATTQDRLDEYRHYLGFARSMGIDCELISPEECKKLWPIADFSDVLGALYHPQDGHIAPADLTQALAKGARDKGAKVHRFTEVTSITRAPSREWHLNTPKGDFVVEHVVTATGNYAWQTGQMVELNVPSIPVLHQFLVTDSVEEVRQSRAIGEPEYPVLRDDKGQFYLRQENDGLLLGPYDHVPPSWAVDGVPADFGADLLPPDLDRVMGHIEAVVARCPDFGEAGIKSVVNGPIAHTPDASPLVGPAPGLDNYWLAEGFTAGILMAGGAGQYLAEWIVNGEASVDMWAVDPRRYGRHVGKRHTTQKNEETYGHIFDIHYPNLQMPASRPAKTSPCYDRLTRAGAVWGETGGWERAEWFAPEGVVETLSYRKSEAFEHVATECRAVREDVGLVELSSFSKFELVGPDAERFLDGLLANRLPRVGRITLSHALTESGKVRSEFTVVRLAEHHFYLIGPALCERQDEDVLRRALSLDLQVTITNITMGWGCFVIAGAKSRDLLKALTDVDLSNEALPWFAVKTFELGWATDIRLLRVNYLGELGYELHHPIAFQHHLLDQIEQAGTALGLRHVGFRALDSLRLEKSYRAIKAELTTEDSLDEAGLSRFVCPEKGDFIGRSAVLAEREKPAARRLVTLSIDCAESDTEPGPNQAVLMEGTVVSRTLSGAFGHFVGAGLALAYLPIPLAEPGTELKLSILGDLYPARVIPDTPHDPTNLRLKAG